MTLYKSKKKLKQTKELHFASCKVVKSNDQRERENDQTYDIKLRHVCVIKGEKRAMHEKKK